MACPERGGKETNMDEPKADPRILEIAEHLKTFLISLDIFSVACPVDELKEALQKMRKVCSTLEAWPFEETMHKAKVMRLQTDTLEALINFMEKRRIQLEFQRSKALTTGEEVLKAMGLS
jgi:hypothetical protein